MASYAPKLPISRDAADGFTVIRDFPTLAKQNLKMLLLTIPGERVMDPEYGVGLQTFLFEAFTANTYSQMDDAIRAQVTLYMPYVAIEDIMFSAADQDYNVLNVTLKYSIPRIGTADLLEITI